MNKTIRQLLDQLGYDSRDYDKDVKGALLELVELREWKEKQKRYEESVARASGL